MVGRGNGNSRSCWMSNGDCSVGALSASYNFRSGPTARLSNAKINSLTYQRILMMGLSSWIGFGNDSNGRGAHHFWLGKDAGGCTYTHMRVATGRCNCASRSVSMSSPRCGSNYGMSIWTCSRPVHGLKCTVQSTATFFCLASWEFRAPSHRHQKPRAQ